MTSEKDDEEKTSQDFPRRKSDGFVEIYSNYADSGYTAYDITLVLSEIKEDDSEKLFQEDKVRVVMSPQNAVSLSRMLKFSIEGWKQEYGENFLQKMMDDTEDSEED